MGEGWMPGDARQVPGGDWEVPESPQVVTSQVTTASRAERRRAGQCSQNESRRLNVWRKFNNHAHGAGRTSATSRDLPPGDLRLSSRD